MLLPDITVLPTPPNRNTPTTFANDADAFLGALPHFRDDLVAFGQALLALAADALSGSSTTPVTIGAGNKTFTIFNVAFVPNQLVAASSAANVANFMRGTVVSYNRGTGQLVINVTTVGGSGTFADWQIGLMASATVPVGSITGLGAAVATFLASPTNVNFLAMTALVKGDVGLGNVDNTADSAKPVSTAQAAAIGAKQDTLVSGTNIKTFGGASMLGSGALPALGVPYGGTGLVALTAGYLPKGNGTSAYSASLIYDSGTAIGIGTASPQSPLHVSGIIRVRIGANAYSTIEPGASPSVSGFYAAWNSAAGRIGYSGFFDGTSYVAAATDGAVAVSFGVNGGEAGRFDTVRNLLVGTTTTTNLFNGAGTNIGTIIQADGSISNQRNNNVNLNLAKDAGATDNAFAAFYSNGTRIGSIEKSGGATVYLTTSDGELKEDDGPLSAEEAHRPIEDIRVHKFRWKADGSEDIGVFAQELYEVYPKAVRRGGWRDPETGELSDDEMTGASYVPWAVDYAKLVPVLLRLVQDHAEQLAALKAA